MGLLEVHSGLTLWTIITFIVLLIVLSKTAWPAIVGALDEREKKIRESLDEADKAREEAVRISKEYDSMVAKARHEAQGIIEEGRKVAEKMKNEIVSDAQGQSSRMLEKAKIEIEQERDKAKDEIRDMVVELTISTTSKLLSKTLDSKDHINLINQSLDEIKAGMQNEN